MKFFFIVIALLAMNGFSGELKLLSSKKWTWRNGIELNVTISSYKDGDGYRYVVDFCSASTDNFYGVFYIIDAYGRQVGSKFLKSDEGYHYNGCRRIDTSFNTGKLGTDFSTSDITKSKY